MTRKKKQTPRSGGSEHLTSAQHRVKELLERLFAGNESAMGKALGCSQSAISQIVHGRRGVGGRILRLMAALPGVSPDWALLGNGLPPTTQFQRDPTKCFLPVFFSLDFALAVDPAKTPTSKGEQVRPIDYSDTRVIFEVPEGHICVRQFGRRLKPGDLLLVETDRRLWISNPSFLDGRICLLAALTDQGTSGVELVRVNLKRDTHEKSAAALIVRGQRWIDPSEAAQLGPERARQEAVAETRKDFRKKYGREPRTIRISDEFASTSSSPRSPPRPPRTLQVDEVLAVSIRLIGVP